MKRIAIITALALFGICQSGWAQQSLYKSGSIYSYYGIGTPNDYRDPAAEGMGLTGVGTYTHSSTLANPAMWGLAFYTSGTGGFSINYLHAEDNNNNQSRTILQPTHFQLVLPVSKRRIGISVGLYQLSNMDYNYQNTGSLDSTVTVGGNQVGYLVSNIGDGGLNALEFGVGWHITPAIAIGYAPSIVFGPLIDQVRTSFDNASYEPVRYDRKITNIGMGNRVGLFLDKEHIFDKQDVLSFGATLNFPVNLTSKNSIESYIYDQTGNVTNSTVTFSTDHMHLPLEAGAGLSYWFNSRFMLAAEGIYQKWSNFKDITGTTPAYMKDRFRYGFGAQLLPKPSRSANLLTHLAYRFGISYDTGYLKLRNTGIKGWSVSAGVGIPAQSPIIGSTIDIDLQYGFLGTTSHDLVRERIFSVRLALNLSEVMFFKKRIE